MNKGKFDLPLLSELPPMNETTSNKEVGELRLCDLPPFLEDDFQAIFINKQIEEDREFRRKREELKNHRVERSEGSIW
jgi:hypothetical protein